MPELNHHPHKPLLIILILKADQVLINPGLFLLLDRSLQTIGSLIIHNQYNSNESKNK